MISLPSKPAQNVMARSQFFVPTALLANNSAATSLWVDNVTSASTLYPTNINNSTNIGAVQTYITGQYGASGTITIRAATTFSNLMVQNESRYMVAEPFFNKYKQWVSVGINTDVSAYSTKTVSGVPNANFQESVYISGNKFIVYWGTATGTGVLMCGEVQSDGTITWGAEVAMADNQANHNYGRVISLGTDKFAIMYRELSSGNPKLAVGTISGQTITLGAGVVMDATVVDNAGDVCKLDTDKVLCTYTASAAQYYIVATISALVPTFGTRVTGGTYTNNNCLWLVQNGTDKAFNVFRDGQGCRAIMITVSLTVPTVNTAIEVASISNQEGYPTHQSQAGWAGGVLKVATDKFLIITYEITSGRNNTFIVTASGATLTKATYQQIPYATAGANSGLVEVVAGSKYAYYNGAPAAGDGSYPASFLLNIDGSNNVTLQARKTVVQFVTVGGDVYDYYWYEKVGNYMVGFRNNQGDMNFQYIVGSLVPTIEVYNGTTQVNSTYTINWGLVYQPLDLLVSAGAIGGSKGYLRIKKTSAGSERITIGDVIAIVE